MKKIITILAILTVSLVNAQAYKGKGDTKFQVGLSLQNGGTGINSTLDFGIGENMSFGFSANYLLKADSQLTFNGAALVSTEPEFLDRADLKARFNANIGNVLKIDEKLDIYPGLHLGLRNFGMHLGARYFFTDGFGIYTEASLPIAKYDSNIKTFDYYNNQFTFNIGASFNL